MNFNEKVWQKGVQKLIEEKDELEKQNRELQARNTELVEKNRELQKELPVNQYGFQSEGKFQPGEVIEVADAEAVHFNEGIRIPGNVQNGDRVIVNIFKPDDDCPSEQVISFYFLYKHNKDDPWISRGRNFKRIEED